MPKLSNERLREIATGWNGDNQSLGSAIKGSEIGAMAREIMLLRSAVEAARAMKGHLQRMYNWHPANPKKGELQLIAEIFDNCSDAVGIEYVR